MFDIWGIILAAGESKRMKVQKLLLPFDGITMIEKVIENVINSKVDHTVVVLGSDNKEIMKVIGHLPVTICYNDNYRQGMFSSIKCGIKTLPHCCDAVLIFLGDQPMIPVEAINMVIKAYCNSNKSIVIPTFEQKRGHPLLIDKKYFEEIEKLDDQSGLRALAVKFPEDLLEVETGMSGILRDIDTKEEYESAINEILLKWKKQFTLN
jgi:molybdenum cofactor cytidylyltransferase